MTKRPWRANTTRVSTIYKPTLESTELADRNREPPFAFNLSMIVCVLQFANCLGFYPGLHRPTSRVIRCHGCSMFICLYRTESEGPANMFQKIGILSHQIYAIVSNVTQTSRSRRTAV